MTDLDSRLSDADVQKVIARALELQAINAQALTVAQIREIASELSIPESAVDQALSEHHAAIAQPDPATARGRIGRRAMISARWVGGALVLLVVASIIMRIFVD